MTAADEQWAGVAIGSRDALCKLGYHIGPNCLPGEPDACGGSFAEHAAGHFAAIIAVARHQLRHLDAPRGEVRAMIARVAAELDRDCHHGGGGDAWP